MPISAMKNFALSTLSSPPSGTAGTELTVATGHGSLFPVAPFYATIWPSGVAPTASNAEIVRVTAKVSDTFTVTRAAESSTARTFRVNDQIAATITVQTVVDAVNGKMFSVSDPTYGAVGGATNDTAAFEACCAAAAAEGTGRVLIPFDTFTVTGPADASGCAIVGNGNTVVSGYFENAASVEGLTIAGVHQDYTAQHPTIPFDTAMKAIRYVDANTYHLLAPSATGGYALMVLANNVTTTNNSLASTAADETQFRVTGMLHCVECLTGYLTASAEDGTWAAQSLSTHVPTFDAGSYYNYTQGTTIAAYKEFTVTVPYDGFLSVTFLRTTTASDDVDITIDSVALESTIDTSIGSGTALLTKTYTVTPGSRVIRITNATAGATDLNIVGLNFAPLVLQRPDVSVDTVGYYRNDAAYISPIETNSANDYTIRDASSGLYGGSYHGGEGSFALDILINGVDTTISSGARVGRSIELVQTSTITWTGGDPVVAVTTRHVAHTGGYSLAVTLDGAVTASEYYTTLVGLNEDYTHVAFPESFAFSGLSDNQRYSLGLTNAVEYRSSTTGQRLRITHSTYSQMESRYGGAFIWKVVGSYLKYYNPYIHTGSRAVGQLAAVLTVQES